MFPFVMADVAQLGEHLIVAQVAEGSTPFIRPIFSPAVAGLFCASFLRRPTIQAPLRRQRMYSWFPLGPLMAEGTTPSSRRPSVSQHRRTLSTAA